MNHPHEHLTDELLTQFLRSRSADPQFGLLNDIMRTVEAAPQDRPWLGLRPIGLARRTALIIAFALLLATMGAIGVGSLLLRPHLPIEALPDTPDAWSRVLIKTPSGSGSVVSLAAGPSGLLAVVADGQSADLFASADGRDWTLVPADRHPPLQDVVHEGPSAAMVGTERGFLMFGNDVWFSVNGFDWSRLASSAEDPDLREGSVYAAAVGGPGYVAVGSDNRAWYSTDGSDWSLAQVPPAPAELFESQGLAVPTVRMYQVVVAGGILVASGLATSHTADFGLSVPVMWASNDGRTWANVLDARSGELTVVAAGPGSFIAVDSDQDGPADTDRIVVRISADGYGWEQVDVLGPTWSASDGQATVGLGVSSIAASDVGFVAAGGLGQTCLITCPPGDVVIWTSADGRSWSRLPSDERFARAIAGPIVAWGSRFVTGGGHEDQPVIWISDSQP